MSEKESSLASDFLVFLIVLFLGGRRLIRIILGVGLGLGLGPSGNGFDYQTLSHLRRRSLLKSASHQAGQG